MNEIILTLNLTVQEVNTIIAGLQELPAKLANPITRKIQQQAQPQLAEAQNSEE